MLKNFKKFTTWVITIIVLFAVTPIAAHAEWKQNPTGWWYANGDSWYTSWKQIDGKWYYFKSDGYIAHNCYISNKYHLNSNGVWDSTIQGFTIQRPSNWVKTIDSADKTFYKIDNVGTILNEFITTLQGKSQKECMDEITNNLKTTAGIDNITVSNQTFNGKTAQIIDYKINTTTLNKILQIHQVIFFNNNESYVFTFAEPNEISSENMTSINNFLNTIKY